MKKVIVALVLVSVVLMGLMAWIGSRLAPVLRADIEEFVTRKTGRTTTLESFDWALWPALEFRGKGLQVGNPEEREELLILVDSFRVNPGLLSLFSTPREVDAITIERMHLRIPPRRRETAAGRQPAAFQAETREAAATFLISRIEVLETLIELLPRELDRASRIIELHALSLEDFAFDRSSPYEAELTYPQPKGRVEVQGRFGPFNRQAPAQTPVSGSYLFQDADLGTLPEIGGILTSAGRFSGDLRRDSIEGKAEIPEFYLEKIENRVPLEASYTVIREGGGVSLERVLCKIADSELLATGRISPGEGKRGRLVEIHVTSEEARVEDLLRLSLRGERPPLIGALGLEADVAIPPGEGRVLDRMLLTGRFNIQKGEFTDKGFQQKLAQLSRFGSRTPVDEDTFSDMTGEFAVEGGVIAFETLSFGVPGMLIRISGTFDLRSEEMDFRGRVNLERSVSEMASGRLSDWLRVIDPILKGRDGGTSVPIRISGTRAQPFVALDL